MAGKKIFIYDTTLRDGSQAEGVSFSKSDKVRMAERLDEMGVDYIEGGWPGSNPKDVAFFEAMKGKQLRHAKLSAFGSTRRAKVRVEDEENIRLLLEAETPAVAIFGKSWLLHVKDVLKISPAQNLEIVGDSCAYLKDHGREVIFDAEHFFDGYKDNQAYALDIVKKAAASGAGTIALCDTNGGSLPSEIARICEAVKKALPANVVLGIHCHNDAELAVANTLTAASCGFRHIQGTVNGFGERCGNANLCSIIPSLSLKMGFEVLAPGKLASLRDLSVFVDELANLRHSERLPYVGNSAFAHKGGMHVNAVEKNPATFEHVKPELVGNKRRILVSDLSGRSNLVMKAGEQHLDLKDPEAVKRLLAELKLRESLGYEYEAADGSFALLTKRVQNANAPFFELDGFRVIIEKRGHKQACITEATVKVNVKGQHELTAAEGGGPVNALDKALRKALLRFYPEIKDLHLNDFKVRILDGDDGTAAKTRVLIESGDNKDVWGTVGVSENIIQASWEALADSVEYLLYKKMEQAGSGKA